MPQDDLARSASTLLGIAVTRNRPCTAFRAFVLIGLTLVVACYPSVDRIYEPSASRGKVEYRSCGGPPFKELVIPGPVTTSVAARQDGDDIRIDVALTLPMLVTVSAAEDSITVESGDAQQIFRSGPSTLFWYEQKGDIAYVRDARTQLLSEWPALTGPFTGVLSFYIADDSLGEFTVRLPMLLVNDAPYRVPDVSFSAHTVVGLYGINC